jgi:3-hydroxyisobutyrate dehydrogenase
MDTSETKTRVAFFGTGLMGEAMALRLLEAGFELMLYDRAVSRAAQLMEKGAVAAAHPSEALEFADVAIIMVADFPAIEYMFFHDPDAADRLKNKTFIQMSTISPAESFRLKQRIAESGGDFLEAPVLGSLPQAKEGKLLILAGGSRVLYEKWEQLLAHLGDKRFYIGETTQAAAIKLALNQLSASLMAAFSMSLGFLREKAVNVDTFMEILRESALYAPIFDRKLNYMMQRDFTDTNFPLKLLDKEVELMIDDFSRANIDTLLLKAVRNLIKKGIADGYSEQDYSALYNIVHPPR